ncbi:hypothetical protein Tsp_05003 [Trichinella spiralis]|uniref:hypothetical protein n=1 Tax=Trichinella spiralis TaxID=6334 RepID=UPI0001EFE951|nr:hypothetical protein Tsp_05003 [Trichinella spiralis]
MMCIEARYNFQHHLSPENTRRCMPEPGMEPLEKLYINLSEMYQKKVLGEIQDGEELFEMLCEADWKRTAITKMAIDIYNLYSNTNGTNRSYDLQELLQAGSSVSRAGKSVKNVIMLKNSTFTTQQTENSKAEK